ncbi:hypothetical protein GCM10023078_17860 [Gibbsiella greigii]
MVSDPLDNRWYDPSLPGMVRSVGNREFEEEWKPVDQWGRLDFSAVCTDRLEKA